MPIPIADIRAHRCFRAPEKLIVESRQEFKLKILDALDAGATVIVVDFSQCRRIDSSGYGVLVSLNKRARDCGASFSLKGLSHELLEQIKHYNLHTVLDVEQLRQPPASTAV